MSSGRTAISSGSDLEREVASLAERLGLEVGRQIRVGRRLWGAERGCSTGRSPTETDTTTPG